MVPTKVILTILDGWGLGQVPKSDAIKAADTPFMDSLYRQFPHTTLVTYGEEVGLPQGQMGNSEVGHLNIGAGRIVFQELAKINNAIKDGSFFKEETLLEALRYAKKYKKKVHLLGLVSDGGVHSHIDHLLALIDMTQDHELEQVYVHAITDGRDTDPEGGVGYLTQVIQHIEGTSASLATVIGRYYAMDRDKRWERVKLAYDLYIHGTGTPTDNVLESLHASYKDGTTDEFVQPLLVEPSGLISPDDVVIFYNFRTDRPRQLTQVLTQADMPEYDMNALDLYFVTMTRYDEKFKKLKVVYNPKNIAHTLGETLSLAGNTQLRAAETEKYPHVTFFFNGGREEPFVKEDRVLVNSPKVATYDLKPSMSAVELKDAVIVNIEACHPDFVCLNFANTDMVGHTGVWEAAVEAAETVDKCLESVFLTCLDLGYRCLVIADHGNSDYIINEDGSPNTAHTTNPVPCILVGTDVDDITLNPGKLADIAPTILSMMGIDIPAAMTGRNLINTQEKS